MRGTRRLEERPVQLPVASGQIDGALTLPADRRGVVLFAHGSGSGRHSPRNRFVARRLHESALGTLLIDLLTAAEERVDEQTLALRFDIGLLAGRLVAATEWLESDRDTSGLPIGYFGASTGAAAALVAAARKPAVAAIVSRGGRPDLAGPALSRVSAPTLLIVGGDDATVLQLNREALEMITAPKRLQVVAGASHLFEEPGALEEVARLAAAWFAEFLPPAGR